MESTDFKEEKGEDVRLSSQHAVASLTCSNQQFTWVIYLFAPEGSEFRTTKKSKSGLHVALLDTQAAGRNYISRHLIEKLGMESEVKRDTVRPISYGFTGERIESEGTIAFQWMLYDGKTVHDSVTFHVSTTQHEIDMIFGAPYIVEKRLLYSNRELFLPLIEHRKITLCKREKVLSADLN